MIASKASERRDGARKGFNTGFKELDEGIADSPLSARRPLLIFGANGFQLDRAETASLEDPGWRLRESIEPITIAPSRTDLFAAASGDLSRRVHAMQACWLPPRKGTLRNGMAAPEGKLRYNADRHFWITCSGGTTLVQRCHRAMPKE
jgi:hypothetical protein